ncbi:thaumatin-like protein 1 [Elaeis guineensis]|uniref:thaumatin-like protein 1 n=1 Tax=Elaeis guineensis var. tenera TaxID=51953 RepID=UPI003C6D7F93
MASSTSLTLLFFSFLLLTLSHAATFNVVNQCSYTVWAAWADLSNNGGGQQLNQGETWIVTVHAGTTANRIWGRTGCSFDANGNGHCQSGDCGKLACTSYGSPPNTLAEFALNQNSPGYYNNLDFIDISLTQGFNVPMNFRSTSASSSIVISASSSVVIQFSVDISLVQGFNVPMDFRSTSSDCSVDIQCTADVVGQCPSALKVAGGCDDPCTIFNTPQYCCPSGSSCEPTTYSEFFKSLCPNAFSYPKDDATSIFTCLGGTNYNVTFCP